MGIWGKLILVIYAVGQLGTSDERRVGKWVRERMNSWEMRIGENGHFGQISTVLGQIGVYCCQRKCLFVPIAIYGL